MTTHEKNFIRVYGKYFKYVFCYLCKYVKCRDSAEDIAQEVFMRFYEKKYIIEPGTKQTKNLLFKIAKHSALDHLKRKKIEEKNCEKMHIREVTFDENFYQDIQDSYIEGHIVSTVHETIDAFPEVERDIIVSKVIDNKSFTSIKDTKKISRYFLNRIERSFKALIHARLQHYFNCE